MWEGRNKMISFQSIFSSLCDLYKSATPCEDLVADIEKMANDVNDRLHKKYAYEEKVIQTQPVQPKVYKPKSFKEQIGDTPKCPLDGAEMKKRKGAYGDFYGCVHYPKCKGTVPIIDEGKANYQDSIDDQASHGVPEEYR